MFFLSRLGALIDPIQRLVRGVHQRARYSGPGQFKTPTWQSTIVRKINDPEWYKDCHLSLEMSVSDICGSWNCTNPFFPCFRLMIDGRGRCCNSERCMCKLHKPNQTSTNELFTSPTKCHDSKVPWYKDKSRYF